MNYPVNEYLKKLKGCFIGKSVGGTLGMPYEGDLRVNEVTYYDPVPTSMVANDDLDLQVIALELVRRRGLPVSANYLCELWQKNATCYPDEYGVANNNTSIGLNAPLSGYYSNRFGGGMGAAIRSELWACLAPADPDLAVRLAREDASTDHWGDGVDACLFLTAVESWAFVESDPEKLIAKGLSYITGNTRMTNAFTDVVKWWKEYRDMLKIREMIISNYPSHNWTDVTINLSLILLAWLAGEGDFSRCICAAASLGYDADCTCATLGAILGIIDVDAIEEKWTWPIGEDLVLSRNIVGMHEAATIGGFCAQIFETCGEIQKFYGSECRLEGDVPAYTGAAPWTGFRWLTPLSASDPATLSVAALKPLTVRIVYPEKVALMTGQRARFALEIINPMMRTAKGSFSLRAPDGFIVEGGGSFDLESGGRAEFEFFVTIPERLRKRAYYNPLDINFDMAGVCWTVTAGLVPAITWLVDGEYADMPGYICEFGPGAHKFVGEFKLFVNQDNARVVAQGTRPLKAAIDGRVFTDHDDSQYVPAMHRCRDVVIMDLEGEWKRVEIEVAQGDDLPGEFMFNIGTRYGWQWLTHLEWRAPAK